MRKFVVWGIALAITAMLVFSCNKNRFDFDHIESVEGSGQWKLPIGSKSITLNQVLGQLVGVSFVSQDPQGNLFIQFDTCFDNSLKGSDLMNIGTLNFSFESSLENPFSGMPLPVPIDTVFYFRQNLEVVGDSIGIESAVIKTGQLNLQTNLLNVSEIFVSSPDITFANGDTLYSQSTVNGACLVDLAGATFRMRDPVTGFPDSTLALNYGIRCQLNESNNNPTLDFTTLIGINNLNLKEVSGYIDSYSFEYSDDIPFDLPLGNFEGEIKLVGAKIEIKEKNTFGNLNAALVIDQAELYGGGATPSPIFHEYPIVLPVVPALTYVNVFPDSTVDLGFNTKFNAVRFHANLDLNLSGVDQLISIYDTSAMGLQVKAIIPMKFNVPGVYFTDTLDINLSEIDAPEILKEILLTINFDSEIPFNLDAQLYTINPNTGAINDSLLVTPMHIGGSFLGSSVHTETGISLTHERLAHLVESGQLIMRFGVDTNGNAEPKPLNLSDGLTVTLKADVIYGGEVDLNN